MKSLIRDGASLKALEANASCSKHNIMAIETPSGNVLGCFMAIPWERKEIYRVPGLSFLWQMKRPRSLDLDGLISSMDSQALDEEDKETYK